MAPELVTTPAPERPPSAVLKLFRLSREPASARISWDWGEPALAAPIWRALLPETVVVPVYGERRPSWSTPFPVRFRPPEPRNPPARMREGNRGARSAPLKTTGPAEMLAARVLKSSTLAAETVAEEAGLELVAVMLPVRVRMLPVTTVGAAAPPPELLKASPASVLAPASVTVGVPLRVMTLAASMTPPAVWVKLAQLRVSPPEGSLPVATRVRGMESTTVPPV